MYVLMQSQASVACCSLLTFHYPITEWLCHTGRAYELSRIGVYLSSIGAFEHTLLGPGGWTAPPKASPHVAAAAAFPPTAGTHLGASAAMDAAFAAPSPVMLTGRWEQGRADSAAMLWADSGRAIEVLADMNQDMVG